MNNNQLNSFINRIEKCQDEADIIKADIKEIYSEAKAFGYDPKIMRKVIALRRQDADKREEEQALIDTYLAALGDLADTPLGQASIDALRGGRE
jgi:uncharacterized protein (UPF0335 family)